MSQFHVSWEENLRKHSSTWENIILNINRIFKKLTELKFYIKIVTYFLIILKIFIVLNKLFTQYLM